MTFAQPSSLTYVDIVHELESRGMMPETAPSLEPMRLALKRVIDFKQLTPEKTILVAGTNGKGSTCATLEALLLEAGESVGLYTSPHLADTTERIRINGQDISHLFFCKAYRIIAERTTALTLSHFEMLTLMAIWIFYADFPKLTWKIFEIGLGGTWDATNILPHHFSVITSLSFDHESILGSSLEEIAANKFGIITPRSCVIHATLPPEVQSLAQKIQTQTQSRWIEASPFPSSMEYSDTSQEPQTVLHTPWGNTPLTLAGPRGAQNTTLALAAFEAMGFKPHTYLTALQKVRWPGRMECVPVQDCAGSVYLSGDHNPNGIQSLIEILKHYPRRHLFILLGIGKDKNLNGILEPLFQLKQTSIYFTESPFRGRSLVEYGPWLAKAHGSSPHPAQLFEELKSRLHANDLLLITGSLYLVGFFKNYLKTPLIAIAERVPNTANV